MEFDLSDKKTKELIEKITQKYSLELILLFGSRARGDARENSDFDIAVFGKNKIDLNESSLLMLDLALVFKSEKIDVVDLKTAHPLLLYGVMRDAKILWGDVMIFYELHAAAYKKYIEAKPIYEEMYKRLNEYLAA